MEIRQSNKEIALKFLEFIADRKIDEAFEYVDASGTHHNPFYPAGIQALQEKMKEADPNVPEKKVNIKNVLSDDNLIAVHFQLSLQDYEMAVVYIFRFENNRIVELWDIGMPIPGDAPNKENTF